MAVQPACKLQHGREAEAVAALLSSQGFGNVRAKRDLAGVERAIMGQRVTV